MARDNHHDRAEAARRALDRPPRSGPGGCTLLLFRVLDAIEAAVERVKWRRHGR